jgi:tetratricopeptide (TPR) repeat protein
MATFNSPLRCQEKRKALAALFIFFATVILTLADETQNKIFAGRAEKEFFRAQTQWLANTNDLTAAWQFGRAVYDWADFAQSDHARADIATQGIDACRDAIARDPKIAAAHYYLAMDSGQLARTKLLGALKIVREMESEFLTAENLDPRFDFAGPARNLGLLYYEAPSIGSIGSKRKARKWLQRAAQLAPDYPENYLNLIEAYLKWDERADAKSELAALEALWPKAQKQFTGVAWESSWTDWIARRDTAEKQLAK